MAEKIGFSAYAVGQDNQDPMTQAIHALLDHAAKQDQRLQEVMEQLAKLGADVETDAEVGKAFDVNYLNKIVD
jgi:serine O-acetyltransferase